MAIRPAKLDPFFAATRVCLAASPTASAWYKDERRAEHILAAPAFSHGTARYITMHLVGDVSTR